MKLDEIKITLRGEHSELAVYIDVDDNSLGRKWLAALNHLLQNQYHLEKNWLDQHRTRFRISLCADQSQHTSDQFQQCKLHNQ